MIEPLAQAEVVEVVGDQLVAQEGRSGKNIWARI
jgi:hypothetical protein